MGLFVNMTVLEVITIKKKSSRFWNGRNTTSPLRRNSLTGGEGERQPHG